MSEAMSPTPAEWRGRIQPLSVLMFTSETFKIISFSDIIDLVGDVEDLDISYGDADFTLLNLASFMYLLERQKTFEECGKVWDSVKESLKITGDLMPYDIEDIYVNLEM